VHARHLAVKVVLRRQVGARRVGLVAALVVLQGQLDGGVDDLLELGVEAAEGVGHRQLLLVLAQLGHRRHRHVAARHSTQLVPDASFFEEVDVIVVAVFLVAQLFEDQEGGGGAQPPLRHHHHGAVVPLPLIGCFRRPARVFAGNVVQQVDGEGNDQSVQLMMAAAAFLVR